MTRKRTEQIIASVFNLSCNVFLPFLIAITAAINKTAVMPFTVAYIGGKNRRGSTSKPNFLKFIPNKAATATGIIIDKMVITRLYFFSVCSIVLIQ